MQEIKLFGRYVIRPDNGKTWAVSDILTTSDKGKEENVWKEYMDEVVIDSIDKGFSLAYSEWSKKYIQFFNYDFTKGIRWQSDEFKINLINFINK